MSDTIREQIITAIEAKLAHILTSKGYLTECGANVKRVLKALDQEELPAVVVFPKPEVTTREYGNDANVMKVGLRALTVFDPVTENASEVAEQLLADLKEVMCGRRWSMSFKSGGTYEPQPGDTITGATSAATAYVESVTTTGGAWAAGTAAGTIYLRRLTGRFTFTAAIVSPATPEVNENLNVPGHANCMTTNGAQTYIEPETSTCAGLATDIRYTGGGPDEYPEAPDTTVGVGVEFEITYSTVAGNPFARPT
jgi:hypothetical protein